MINTLKDRFFSKNSDQEKEEIERKKKSAQDWQPAYDVSDGFMYRRDNHIVAVIKIEPINIDLLSKNEKKRIISSFHEVLNGLQESIQIMSIGKPVDLDSYIAGLENKADSIGFEKTRKRLLKNYIRHTASIATGGQAIERKFFIFMSQKDKEFAKDELTNKAQELISRLGGAGITAKICTDKDIIDLLFLFNQPKKSAHERTPDFSGPYLPTQLGEGVFEIE